MKACVFPGQGSQAVGMGEDLFACYPEILAAADEILGYSLAELCLRDPQGRLNQTQHTQPALYVVNALSYRSLRDGGMPPPDFVAGHSLGEYNALLAAEVFDFETGLRLVKRRGELMSAASGGGMAAVLRCDAGTVEEVLRRNGLSSIDVANYNTLSQVVLSGPAEDIARAEDLFVGLGVIYIPLKNVSAAFHSRYMEFLMDPLGELLAELELAPPKIPVISNVSARPYADGEVKQSLQRQIREPVRWTESIQYLLEAGVDNFQEVGPGTVLTKLIRSIRKPSSRPRASEPAPPFAIAAERLGAASFRRDYGVRRAYGAGAMDHGITSKELVVRMGQAGYLGFLGAGGLRLGEIDESIQWIKRSLRAGEPFGVSLLSSPDDPETEMAIVEICLRHGVRLLEAVRYVTPSPALIWFRLKGVPQGGDGRLVSQNKVIARVSRPDVAEAFLKPPPEEAVAELLRAGRISGAEARLARRLPMADDLGVDVGSGDLGGIDVLLPAVIRLRDELGRGRDQELHVRVGAAGEIGTPEAAAAAFLLGADFLLTGSINQCTVEAGTSEAVKDLLETINVQDVEQAPASDLFELGAKIRVLKKGVLFPGRANRLFDLWRHHGAWEEIDPATRAKIERDYFGRSFERVFAEEVSSGLAPQEAGQAEREERHKMALVFRWYLGWTLQLALAGAEGQRSNYQVPCGPALGAFNQWMKGTPLEPWRKRHVDIIADKIMEGAAEVLSTELQRLAAADEPES